MTAHEALALSRRARRRIRRPPNRLRASVDAYARQVTAAEDRAHRALVRGCVSLVLAATVLGAVVAVVLRGWA